MKRWIILLMVGMVGWGLRLWWVQRGAQELEEGQRVKIVGRVSGQPSIKVDQFTGEEYQWGWVAVGGQQFGFRMGRWPEVEYGEEVEVTGKLKVQSEKLKIKVESLKFLGELAPRRWIVEKAEVGYVGSVGDVGILGRWRQEVLGLFRRTLPRDEAGLLAGMVLGTKGELSEELYEALRQSGTLHVVVASGFNVMLVGGAVTGLAMVWARRAIGLVWGIGVIWLYVILVRWEAPVVRAGLMGTLGYLGIVLGRPREAGWLLGVSAVGMLWWKPEWVWDVGWQLSVAATAGLVWLEPKLKIKNEKLRIEEKGLGVKIYDLRKFFEFPVIGESLRTTIAAQVAVAPILWWHFGQFTWWSPLVNVMVLWVVPIVTGVGMIDGILWLVVGQVGKVGEVGIQLLLWLIWPLLKYFVMVVEWGG